MKTQLIITLTVAALIAVGCEQKSTPEAATHAAAAGPALHEHHAPHGGCLVELGEEFAHLELVLDPATGKLTAYLLDGEAEKPVRTTQDLIRIRIRFPFAIDAKTPLELGPVSVLPTSQPAGSTTQPVVTDVDIILMAVASKLTGESIGDSSQFEGRSNLLIGLRNFDGKLVGIHARGKDFGDVDFSYPAGNEAHGNEAGK